MIASLRNYICRLLDATDRGADCLAFGILLGFLGFNTLFAVITFLIAAHALFPNHVLFDAGGTAVAVASMAGSYVSVLTATAAAYRWRKVDAGPEKTAP